MVSYFGNVLSLPFGKMKIEDLKEKTLTLVANEAHELLQTALTKEHFLGLIDWVEEHRPEMGLPKIYAATVTEEEPAGGGGVVRAGFSSEKDGLWVGIASVWYREIRL
ncbi:hypothetical protein ACS0TY_017536 [Phlomoides rotata]